MVLLNLPHKIESCSEIRNAIFVAIVTSLFPSYCVHTYTQQYVRTCTYILLNRQIGAKIDSVIIAQESTKPFHLVIWQIWQIKVSRITADGDSLLQILVLY